MGRLFSLRPQEKAAAFRAKSIQPRSSSRRDSFYPLLFKNHPALTLCEGLLKIRMPYLIESYEWRLLKGLAGLLSHRKARYQAPRDSHNDGRTMRLDADLFEVELRRVFMVEDSPRQLKESEFTEIQARLTGLCSLLDVLVWPQIARHGPNSQTYPGLSSLTGYLETTSGLVDLASGDNETLFQLPPDAVDLSRHLRVVTDCNHALGQLLDSPRHEPVITPLQGHRKKKRWKEARLRDRTLSILGYLFKHFKCETPHEVLLGLDEDLDGDLVPPNARLMLSSCPEFKLWHEVRCPDGLCVR